MTEDGTPAVRWPLVLLLCSSVPVLFLGVALTASVFGAVFGIPILLVEAPLARAEWRWWRCRDGRTGLVRWAALHAVSVTIALAVALVVGFDDLDGVVDLVFAVVGVAGVVLPWVAIAALVRGTPSPSAPAPVALPG